MEPLTCGLQIGDVVRHRGLDWTVSGGPAGPNHLEEVLDFVYLVRDRHVDSFSGRPAFTAMGAHVPALRGALIERVGVLLRARRDGLRPAGRTARGATPSGPPLGRGAEPRPGASDVRPGARDRRHVPGLMSAHS